MSNGGDILKKRADRDKKSRTASISAAIFAAMFISGKKLGSGKVGKKFRIGGFLLQSVRLPEANNFFRP